MRFSSCHLLSFFAISILVFLPLTFSYTFPFITTSTSSDYPSYWDRHGFLLLFGLLTFPSVTLILATNIQWSFYYIISAVFYPYPTLCFIVWSRGYYHHNYILTFGLLVITWTTYRSSWQKKSETVETQSTPSERSNPSTTVQTTSHFTGDLAILLEAAREKLSKFEGCVRRLALFEGREPALANLNVPQLMHLRRALEHTIEKINMVIFQKTNRSKRRNSRTTIASHYAEERCVICLDQAPQIEFHPCSHRCMCEDCFLSFQNSQVSQNNGDSEPTLHLDCPICKIPITEYTYPYKDYLVGGRMTEDDYRAQILDCTTREVMKLCNYVRTNPAALNRLKNPEILKTLINVQ